MPTEPVIATVVASPRGPILVAVSSAGVVAVEVETTREALEAALAKRRRGPVVWAPEQAPIPPLLGRVIAAITAAATDDPAAQSALQAVPLDLADRPAWDREVLAAVRAIPRGETRGYGDVARAIGRPGAARAVGGAVSRNPVAFLVPCHRVVAGDGTLGGYGGSWWGEQERQLERKAELLELEGVTLPRSVPGGRPRPRRGR